MKVVFVCCINLRGKLRSGIGISYLRGLESVDVNRCIDFFGKFFWWFCGLIVKLVRLDYCKLEIE